MKRRFGTGKRYLFGVAVAGLLLSAAQVRAQGERPACHVLSVGIDAYAQGPLKGCVNDARNMAQAFESQHGKLFSNVGVTLLLDRDGSRARIGQELDRIRTAGNAGDFIVIFLSGHGGNQNRGWFFLPQDYTGQHQDKVTDISLLRLADTLAGQGKKVLVIVDACFAGQLRVNARDQLNKSYPQGGGVVLMVSSMPSQTSAAMGAYSAFAQAVFEGLSGHGDFDGDGFVTLREVRRYAYQRVHDLLPGGKQDGEIEASLTIGDNLQLAKAMKPTNGHVALRPPPADDAPALRLAGSIWHGRENLQGFGDLTFRFAGDNQVTMLDTAGSTPGTFSVNGDQVTLTFNNGQVVYTGRVQGNTLAGSARGSRGQIWQWAVRLP